MMLWRKAKRLVLSSLGIVAIIAMSTPSLNAKTNSPPDNIANESTKGASPCPPACLKEDPSTNSATDGGSKQITKGLLLFVAFALLFVLFFYLVRRRNYRLLSIAEESPKIDSNESFVPITDWPNETIAKTPSGVATNDEIKKVAPSASPRVVERPILSTQTIAEQAIDQDVKSELQKLDSNIRSIVSQPQIGDASSFAKYEWWDKDREWCQVSPRGMSNDIVCDIGTSGSIAIAAASIRGHKHKVDSKACQDAFSLRATKSRSGEDFFIAVLCDGMSSAKFSQYGARRTSQLLARCLDGIIRNEDVVTENAIKFKLPEAFDYCKKNLIPKDNDQFGAPDVILEDVKESDFFTTVTFMILPSAKQSSGTLEVIVGSIGDSAIFALRENTGIWQEAGRLESEVDIVNPATSAFPATFDTKILTVTIAKTDVIVATSDGVGNFLSVRGKQTSLGTYLAKQWVRPVNAATFINDLCFDLKSADDDRTAIVIWPSRE